MPEEQEGLCESCGQRPATVFLAKCFGGSSKPMEKTDLCASCYEETAVEFMGSGSCIYCGAPASGGFRDPILGMQGTCNECTMAGYAFMRRALGLNPEERSSGDLVEALRKVNDFPPEAKAEVLRNLAAVEEHLRKRKHS